MNLNSDVVSSIADEEQASIVGHALASLSDSSLDPLFWRAQRLGAPSSWWLHVPFAHWIVCAARPNLLVELGTHAGVSYSAFCQAVRLARLPTRCHAVDTWRGDFHAGEYDESVFIEFSAYHDEHFGTFSTLIRETFDDALARVEDASVDLLHIDGLHTYEAVRHDFESWHPKLSDGAVVLFHDINERSGDFGVWRLWKELCARFPSFTFLHGHGLGVLAVGEQASGTVLDLCRLDDPGQVATVRERFARLGQTWLSETRERMGGQRIGVLTGETDRLKAALAHATGPERDAVRAQVAERDEAAARLQAELDRLASTVATQAEAAERAEQTNAERDRLAQRVQEMEAAAARQAQAEAVLRDQSVQRATEARRHAGRLQEEIRRAHEAGGLAEVATRTVRDEAAELRRQLAHARERLRQAEVAHADIAADRAALRNLHEQFVQSSFWRASRPLRRAAERVPPKVRRAVRGVLKLTWWTATLRLPSKLEERRGRIAQFAAEAAAAAPLGIAPPAPSFEPAPAQVGGMRLLYVSGEPETPGHLYRIERYIAAAAAAGAEAATIRVADIPGTLDAIESATVLVLWRTPWCDEIAVAVAAARRGGARIVFDVDDLMVDPSLARLDIIDGIRSQFLTEDMVRDHYARVRQTMETADACFTTTEELAFHLRWSGKTTFVLPNGFDAATHDYSRRVARAWRQNRSDRLIRIGYAGGSRTHQKDFGLAVEAIARLLRENAQCRLVLFRSPDGTARLIDVEEFPALAGLEDRIEWRPLQPLSTLAAELARFDINIAPLEYDNPFCEAKSELKFFEAALVDVPTVASTTGPFQRAIAHGRTGFLAASADDWYDALKRLVDDPDLRARIAAVAYPSSLASFGPLRRELAFRRVLAQLHGGPAAADAFALEAAHASRPRTPPRVYRSDIVFEQDAGGMAHVSVMVPLYNYETYVLEALDSVHAQTLEALDLVIVDGCSTDNSLAVARDWAGRHAARFNRIVVLKNRANYGLAFCRNSGFDAAHTPYVLPLDADNKLLPECCERLLYAIERAGAAFAYATIQHFGASSGLLSNAPWEPHHLVAGNYIDAMALVSKEAWAVAGGYDHVRHGWEDFDFWCRMAECGLSGHWHREILALYRVHEASMMRTQTLAGGNYKRLVETFKGRHPWVSLLDHYQFRQMPKSDPRLREGAERSRLDALLPILRCPDTGARLAWNADRTALLSVDGTRSWPVSNGRPVLAPQLADPPIHPDSHISNELPEEALALIRGTSGLVLNLSAGGSRHKFDHVVEVEYAIFRHTDIVADAHVLPFYDETFEAVVVMNAFEHYREPHRVAAELKRILKPGGRILVRTAFMQPLHERPWHFFNCTRYGLEEWFNSFETETLHVSTNFCPNHSVAWLASEAEEALRTDVSEGAARAFEAASIGKLVELWRDPAKRADPLWTDFEKLSQTNQEVIAAGFEFLGRKPSTFPI